MENHGNLLSRSALHWQKFRESNGFSEQITKELISRKKISVSMQLN